MNKKAFTLIELLIAILIIMILAGYSLFAYLDSLYEAENTQAKARLELINSGYERFHIEYPSAALTGQFANDAGTVACARTDLSAMRLVRCGYVPRIDFTDLKYNFYIGNAISCGCGVDSYGRAICDGWAFMGPKEGEDLGKFGASRKYCAGVNMMKGGKAADGATP